MPWESKKQQRWGHGKGGKKAGFTPEKIKEWDDKTAFDSLPEEAAQAGKGPGRTQGPGQNLPEGVKEMRRHSREIHKETPQQKPGPHTTKKGKKGYDRKQKHKGGDYSVGEELTPVDETYRGMRFPLAETLNWGGSMKYSIADLSWSTHKQETFNDTGKKGDFPAWGLKSVIDRGVRPHENSAGNKRIGEGENQTQKRNIGNGKKFKSYSMTDAFCWETTAFPLPAEGRPCEEGEDPKKGKCNPNRPPGSDEGGGMGMQPQQQAGPGDWELPPGGEEESMLPLMQPGDPGMWQPPEGQQGLELEPGPGDWELPPGGEDEPLMLEQPSREYRPPMSERERQRKEPEYYKRTLMGFAWE